MIAPRRWLVVAALALLGWAAPARAQYPAELSGRVVEQGGAQPIEGALVEIEGGARAISDAAGAFTLRSAEDGALRVRVTRAGYATLAADVRLESGRTTTVVLELVVAPIEIDALAVVAEREVAAGAFFTRDEIEASGARTLGELIRTVPGVLVRDDGGSAQRVSIRGSSADEVLVVVDGAAVNDPLTGEADLSLVSLQGVESVRVLPGAQSARRGGRAQAGVVLVETALSAPVGVSASARAGTLGTADVDLEGSAHALGAALLAGARFHRLDGEFRFDMPESLGGGTATRANREERELGAYASVAAAGGRIRVDHARAERGLPGPVHAPTPEAGQERARTALSAGWRVAGERLAARVDAQAAWQTLRFEDAEPAFGDAYFDTTRARDLGVRAEAEHVAGARVRRELGLGAEMRATRLESSALEPRVVDRSDPAFFGRAALEFPSARLAPRLALAARGDRWDGDWIASHEVALRLRLGAVTLDAAQRSAFSPPAASDQFFGSGFAIEPNPELEPERVRSELELGLSGALTLGRVPVALGASAFRGDIDGMIVWAPDFRFVWSPRNRDVKRSGGEAWARAGLARDLDVGAWASAARVTYDWPGDADTVQVVYRPRYTGGATLDWTPRAWRVGGQALYTGVRYATPGHSNPLPGYWDVRLALGREWRRGPVLLDASLRIERLLDNTDSFIHGYPEAGRRLYLELGVRPTEASFTVTAGVDR